MHAGLYYERGSLKARLTRRGVGLLQDFCAEHDVAYDGCGKLVVATTSTELDRLEAILDRARANGVPGVRMVDKAGIREVEPHCLGGVAALHSPETVPFYGDYLHLRPERTHLVRGLIYPVPDPRFPSSGCT